MGWEYLSHGAYHNVYINSRRTKVKKVSAPLPHVYTEVAKASRGARIFKEIYPEYGASVKVDESSQSWIMPYFPLNVDQHHSDADLAIANEVFQIYYRTGRIILDAVTSDNFKWDPKFKRPICIDVDLAVRRNSVVSQEVLRRSKQGLHEMVSTGQYQFPLTTAMIFNLIAFDDSIKVNKNIIKQYSKSIIYAVVCSSHLLKADTPFPRLLNVLEFLKRLSPDFITTTVVTCMLQNNCLAAVMRLRQTLEPQYHQDCFKKFFADPKLQKIYSWLHNIPILATPHIDKTIFEDQSLQAVLCWLQATFPPGLITAVCAKEFFRNESFRKAIYAAYGYVHSGRFGFFNFHGRDGQVRTQEFVTTLLMELNQKGTLSEPSLKQHMQNWLKKNPHGRGSNAHRHSRSAYACASGLLITSKAFNKRDSSYRERVEVLNEMINLKIA